MKKLFAAVIILLSISSCKNKKNIPDVGNVKVDVTTLRFEQDFFQIDSTKTDVELQKLFEKYPVFSIDFFQNVLGANPNPDSIQKTVLLFKNAYQGVYEESKKQFVDFSNEEKQIKQGFQFVKHYFPKYQLPTKLITYIGPWDAMFMLSDNSTASAVLRDGDVLGIGLQFSLGKDFFLYKQDVMQQFYPDFISRKFSKEYIAVNAINVIVDDLYPNKANNKPLVEQMIEAGKRMYLLDAFLPNLADTLKIGYTANQLKGCYEHEANIWSFFVTNDLVFATEPAIVKDYMTDGPKTPALGDESPGYIGKFIGWQIVKKWMEKNENTTLEQLIKTPAKEIFEKSKYKP